MNRRIPPDDDEYTVVGCTKCDNLQIVKGAPKTTNCKRCTRTMTFKKLKQFYRTKNREAAANARALKLAARAGDEEQFKMLLESGSLNIGDARAVTDAEFLRKNGINPDILDEDESTSSREAVAEALDSLDNPTVPDIVAYVDEEHGLAESEVRREIDRRSQRGDIMRRPDGTVRIL